MTILKNVFLCAICTVPFIACSKARTVSPSLQAEPSYERTSPLQTAESLRTSAYTTVDIDLTTLSSVMVYAEVFNMMLEPESYVQKRVRMRGLFYTQQNEWGTGERTYTCIVQDATACCASGLEFRLKESLSYPDDFPPLYEEITIRGTFFYYEDNGLSYFGIKDAVFE